MYKLKFQRLNKEEKKKEKEEFFSTTRGKELRSRFNRILLYSILLVMFGILLLVEGINKDSIAQIIYSILILIFSLIFVIARYYIMIKQVNDYIINKELKKKAKKK